MCLKEGLLSLDRGQPSQGSVMPVVVVVLEIGGQCSSCIKLKTGKAAGSVELVLDSAMEPLDLAIGLGPSDPGKAVADIPRAKGASEAADASPRTSSKSRTRSPSEGDIVVCENSADRKPEIPLGSLDGLQGRIGSTDWRSGGVGHPGVAIDEGELVDLFFAFQRPQVQHIQVHQLAGLFGFEAHHAGSRRSWKPAHAMTTKAPVDGGLGQAYQGR